MDLGRFNYDVVAFAAHPDDAEICCGGLLIKMSRLGYRTAVVDYTRGELGSRGSIETRAVEAATASKIMGLAHRENLGLADGKLDAADSGAKGSKAESHLCAVIACLRRLRPEIVVAPYHKCRHPDHYAASRLLTRAVYLAGLRNYKISDGLEDENESFTPRQVIYYQMRFQFKPSFIVDISEVEETKRKAYSAYGSQLSVDELGNWIDQGANQPKTLISSPLNVESIQARERYYGSMIGVRFAEPYLTHNALSVPDPLKHFRENSVHTAFNFT